MTQRWLTIREYADERKVSTKTVFRWIAAGRVKVVRYSKRTVRVVLGTQEDSSGRTSYKPNS